MASENGQEKRETLAEVVATMRFGTKLRGYWTSKDLNEIDAYFDVAGLLRCIDWLLAPATERKEKAI